MNQFIAPQNQKLLWQTMTNSAEFMEKNNKEEWFRTIVGEFYESNKLNNKISLKDINLTTVRFMLARIKEEAAAAADLPIASTALPPRKALGGAGAPLTRQEISDKKQREFSARLETLENEHQYKRQSPPEINFKDTEDGPISNLNELVAQQLERRKELYDSPLDAPAALPDKKVTWAAAPPAPAAAPPAAVPHDYIAKIVDFNEKNYSLILELKNAIVALQNDISIIKNEITPLTSARVSPPLSPMSDSLPPTPMDFIITPPLVPSPPPTERRHISPPPEEPIEEIIKSVELDIAPPEAAVIEEIIAGGDGDSAPPSPPLSPPPDNFVTFRKKKHGKGGR